MGIPDLRDLNLCLLTFGFKDTMKQGLNYGEP
jgi:hypothetical protein